MPTTFAHDYFGRKIYRRLTPEAKQAVSENRDLYRIGLHGPDILFYFMVSKNPVTGYGVKMHNERADAFFKRNIDAIRKTGDEEMLAYLMGFACHYMLDSACHPYVNRMAKEKVISHTLLEKEFDRFLMEKSGKDPLSYRPSDGIRPKWEYAQVIHRVIPEMGTFFIWSTMHFMKKVTNLMVCDDGGKRRKILYGICRIAGKKNAEAVTDYFMMKTPAPGSEIPVRKLKHILDDTIDEAVREINALYMMAEEPEDQGLSERWKRNYQGE